MLITYRRTGGVFALAALAVVALAATVLTVAVAAILAITAVTVAGVVLLGRAVLPRSWLDRAAPAATAWPHETIDTKAVTGTDAPGQREPPRVHGDTG